MNKIKILETIYDGYERLYLLDLTKLGRRIWAYGLDHENYIESGCDKNVIEFEGKPNFSIEWVNSLNEDNFESDELIQPINNSSHSVCKVTVTKVISSYSFECLLEGLGLILGCYGGISTYYQPKDGRFRWWYKLYYHLILCIAFESLNQSSFSFDKF